MKVNIHEAKSQLSRLIKKTLEGEEVVIASAGKPLIKLVALDQSEGKMRLLGHARDQVNLEESFFDPLPTEIEELFNR